MQDDARQYFFWMQRFVDPELFPHDLIADYFQATSPPGYSTLYQLLALAGIDPLSASKLMPLVIGLAMTYYCFRLSVTMLPMPIVGFISTILLNQNVWLKDDILSATPRAFYTPLFLAFLYYLMRRSSLASLVALALQGLFYPQSMLISVGILLLWLWDRERGWLRLSRDRRDYLLGAAGLCVALLVLASYPLRAGDFGPVVSAAEARRWPEFLSGGRLEFFIGDPWKFWLMGGPSGLLPSDLRPPLLWAGLALPFLLWQPTRFPLVRRVYRGVRPLPQILVASVGLFVVAHLLLFRIHFPGRYTGHSLRLVMVLASAIALTVAADAVWRWARARSKAVADERRLIAAGLTALLAIMLLLYPLYWRQIGHTFPTTSSYRVGRAPELYEFFARQPKGALIASLAYEANHLPTFAQRPILVGREYALAFHLGYYRRVRERATDLIAAQYTEDLSEVNRFVRKYGIDFWLLEQSAFRREYLTSNDWIEQYQPAAAQAAASLQLGKLPALAGLVEPCSVFASRAYVVLAAECIAGAPDR